MRTKVFKTGIIITAITVIGFFAFNSCEKNEEINNVIEQEKYGIYHNEILEKFYSSNSLKSTMSFEDKVNEIDKYLSEVVDDVDLGDFSQMLMENQNQFEYLKQISSNSNDIETGKEIISELKLTGEISPKLYSYFNQILNAYEVHAFNFSELTNEVEKIGQKLNNDDDLTEEERGDVSNVITITRASIDFWKNQNSLKSTTGLPWYVKDAVGAMTGVQTGLVGYSSLVFGPVGGAVALVGSAALSSAV